MMRSLTADVWWRVQPWLRHEPLPCRPLIAVAGAMAAGCVAARVCEVPGAAILAVGGWWSAAAVALALWLVFHRRAWPRAAAGSLLLAIATASAAWSMASWSVFPGDDLAWRLTGTATPVAIEGVVVEPLRRLTVPPYGSRLAAARPADAAERLASEATVAVRRVRHGGSWQTVSGRAIVMVDGEPPPVGVGDRVRIIGHGMRPEPGLNPGEFDPRGRARGTRCLSRIRVESAAAVTTLATAKLPTLAALIDKVRGRGAAVLGRCIGPERAGLAAALLIGGREAMPRDEADAYLVTGTIHILSISGLHVGLLAWAICGLVRLAGLRRAAMVAAVVGLTGGYMLLVRPETPVVRSTLVVWLATLGTFLGRRSQGLNALAIAAMVILVVQPAEVFRVGTQLSFLSTAVLVIMAGMRNGRSGGDDPIARLIERSRTPLERRTRRWAFSAVDLFVTGAVIWAVTAPIVAATFHVVSPIALVLNPLIAPLVAVAMAAGFSCLLAAAVSETAALACGRVCDLALGCLDAAVSWGASLPGGHWWTAGPPPWWVAGWCVVIATVLVVVARERQREPGPWACAVGSWMGVGLVAGLGAMCWGPPTDSLRAVVAAVGHGCGVVVRSPAGRCLVYDAGRLGSPAAAGRAMSAVLWEEGLGRIDTLVVSHADADHFNAVPMLLQRFAVGELVVSQAFIDRDTAAVGELLLLARQAGVAVRTVAAGESFALDPHCRVRVLHAEPRRRAAGEEAGRFRWRSDNETSLVMSVEAAGRRLLLTGDVEGESQAAFVAADPDSCDVLVAPHHGSATSLPPDIARATAPDWVLVSGIGGRRWADVMAAYETARGDRPSAVVKTGGEGAIAVDLAAVGVAVSRFREGRWQPLRSAASRLQ
jgi:competence protein ComEC